MGACISSTAEVYAVGHEQLSPARALAGGGARLRRGALLSHRSAAALWGLAAGAERSIDVTARVGRKGGAAARGSGSIAGALHPEERRPSGSGIPVTTVARTLFDYAEVARLPAARASLGGGGPAQTAAASRGRAKSASAGYGRRALKPIRRLLAEATRVTRTRSPLEDRFQGFCRYFDLPPHSTNVEVLGNEVDVLWPAAKLIVELDSWEFHSHRAAFQRDRARDTRLLVAGYRTVRVTHDRLDARSRRSGRRDPERCCKHRWSRLQATSRAERGSEAKSRAALRRRSRPPRSGSGRPARPWLRARPSSPARCPRSRR